MPPNTRRYFEESENSLTGRSPESPEFQALIRSKIGERFKESVTPEKIGLAALIGDPRKSRAFLDLMSIPHGFQAPRTLSPKEVEAYIGGGSLAGIFAKPEQFSEFGAELLDNRQVPEGKRIFGVGSAADAGTWSHEFRHDFEKDEIKNRMMDVIYGSTSLPSYKANIERVYNYLINSDPETTKKKFKEREQMRNASLNNQEKYVLDRLKNNYIEGESVEAELGFLPRIFNLDYIDKNFELNRSGAVGGNKDGKPLPEDILKFRSKLPFLNFIGRLDEPAPKKKAVGGNVEKVYIDRKMI